MSNPAQHEIPELSPGTVIEIADLLELHAFEDVIAPVVNPDYRADSWSTRPRLRDDIKPPKFNGNVTDITLTVMERPYGQLLSAAERGWKLKTNGASGASKGRGHGGGTFTRNAAEDSIGGLQVFGLSVFRECSELR